MQSKTIREIFGEQLKKLRQAHGMSQMDLAYILKYTSSGMVSQIENGKRGMDLEKIHQVVELFNVQPNFFFGEREIKGNDLKLCLAFEAQVMLPPEKRHDYFKCIRTLLLDTMKSNGD